jgi:diguanylate cyclase (GGDEF)-like protein
LSGSDASQPPPKPSRFPDKERVRLWFLVAELLPPPRSVSIGAETGGEEMWELKRLLQEALGRFHIDEGHGIAEVLQNFIQKAPEEDLLTMLQLLPIARVRGSERRGSPFDRVTNSELLSICERINRFLERIGSPARFTGDGILKRDGVVDEAPRTLRALPGRDVLTSDVALLGEGAIVAVIFLDLDNFKMVNDTRGHADGNKCLEKVVEVIGDVIAHKGRLYRYGGDEFVIVLPNSVTSEGTATAERLRLAIRDARPGGDIAVTASIGVAATDMDTIKVSKVVEAADAAMYASKRAQKNCVTVWAPELPSPNNK